MMKHVVVATCHCLVRPVIFVSILHLLARKRAHLFTRLLIGSQKIIENKNALIVSNSKSCTTWDTVKATRWKQVIF